MLSQAWCMPMTDNAVTDPRIEAAARSLWFDNQDAGSEIPLEEATFPQRAMVMAQAKNALAAVDAAAWRPIESAPRDGTPILACGFQRFDAGSPPEPFVSIICWSGNRWQDGTIADQPTPTHWMSLPAPPQEGEG